MLNLKNKNLNSGSILIFNILGIFIFSLVMVSALSYASVQLRTVRSSVDRQQAFQIAEAGLNYYLWRLAHFPNDYTNGTGLAGPYVKDFIDKDTNTKIGEYSLQITAPPTGSTIVTIRSTGYTVANPKVKRTITARYGIPSLAKYAFLSNSDAYIGSTESVSGEFKVNGGVRFDGVGNAPISSARSTYTCPNWSGSPCPTTKNGVWGSASAAVQSYWNFPVPNTDFSSMTSDLSTIKTNAQASGVYLTASGAAGYSIVFKNTGKLDIYRVNTLRSHTTGIDVNGVSHTEDLDYNSRTLLAGYTNIDIPANGLIFIEDRVWVEGMVKGRAMVVAAKLGAAPSSYPSILIPNNICYTTCGAGRDTTSTLGLLAQKDILITYFSPNNLEINAAMIAQTGSTQHYNFGSCGTPRAVKNSITVFGTVASYGIWTWSFVCGNPTISGYTYTYSTYDTNLLYAPPPSFPLTTDGYQQISWTSD